MQKSWSDGRPADELAEAGMFAARPPYVAAPDETAPPPEGEPA